MVLLQSNSSRTPFFLVGGHRSGTTLTGLMLDSHPDLSWFHHFEWAVRHIKPDGTWPSIDEYQKILSKDFGYLCWNLNASYGEPKTYSDVLDGFFEQRRQHDGKPLSGATVHTRYAELPKIWPNAKFIHVVRDPRDVVRSTIKFKWSGNAWGAAQRWKRSEIEWNKLCAIVPSEQRMEFRFEELIANPKDVQRRITHFLEIPYTEAMFSYIEHTPYKYPDPAMAYKWRGKMPRHEIEMVETALGKLLTSRGYENIVDSTSISSIKQANWKITDRAIKFWWRVQRYGWKLWLAQFVSRRLGNPPQLSWALEKVKTLDIEEVRSKIDFIADPNTTLVMQKKI